MSPKSSIFDFRTVLYIMIIVLIMIGVAFGLLAGDDDAGTDIKTPDLILLNPQNFINKNIVVRGIFYSDGDIVANPTTDDDPYANGLHLDLSKINDLTTNLSDGNKYDFHGRLEWDPDSLIPNTIVILRVDDIDPV